MFPEAEVASVRGTTWAARDTLPAMCFRALLFLPVILALLAIPSLAMDLGPEVEMTERVVDAGDGLASHRSVAMVNGLFYVTWTADNSLKVAIFDRDGGQLAEHTLVEGTDPFRTLIINDGSRLVLLWADQNSLRISSLTEDGMLVIPGGLKLRQEAYDLDIAAAAGSYLVSWGNGTSLGGLILDRTFATVASFVDQGGAYRIRAASNGESYLLIWTSSSQPEGLYARRVDPDGTRGAVNLVHGEAGRYTLDVAWNGSHYLAGSAVEPGLGMMLLDEDGVLVGNPVIAWPDVSTVATSLSPHPSGFLVLAEQWGPPSGIPEGPDPSRLFSFIVSPQGVRLTEVLPVSTAYMNNSIPSLVGDGERYFAAWHYSSGGTGFAVRGTIIRGDGEVLFADKRVPGVTISRGVRSQAVGSVARGDHGFLAIWTDAIRERNESSVRFARLDSDGRSMDSAGIELYRSYQPSLACGRAQCLVVWHIEDEGSAIDGLIGRWISLNGRSISAPFVIGPHYRSSYGGFLATDGENFATVVLSTLHIIRPDQNVDFIPIPRPSDAQLWHERLVSNGSGFLLVSLYGRPALSIRAIRFDADGLITNETTLPAAGYSYEFEIASNGSEYLLVNDQLRGLRVSSSGIPLGGYFEISGANGYSPSIGWNGTHWLVAWERHDSFGLPISVHVTKVQRYGGPVETREVAAGGRPRIACSDGGESMVIFESWLDPQRYGSVRRVHARVIDPGPRPTPGPRRRGVRRP